MKFTKMHGAGNDYIYINCFEETVVDPASLSVRLSDRHFGIGGDGIILICPSDIADFKMRIFNADGSEAEMCGNGIRPFGKYVHDKGLTDKTIVSVETLAGIKTLYMNLEDGAVRSVRVDMGEPILDSEKIPVTTKLSTFINQPVSAGDRTYMMTCVSMGNPHAVTFVNDVSKLDLHLIGPKFERHPLFPKRANIEFIECIDDKTLKMRVWERGSGETLACGTGACASLVASVLNGKCSRRAQLILLGGALDIEWNETDNHVYMTGNAELVFDGETFI
jgi:diaminopimelate epimerase